MEPKPHMRKVKVSLSHAEDLTINSIKQMRPDWVRKNGDCPECVTLQHEMADTTRPESAEAAMKNEEEKI